MVGRLGSIYDQETPGTRCASRARWLRFGRDMQSDRLPAIVCSMPYQILEVDPESLIGDEQLGSKPKVWFQRDNGEWLFKEARANTGEDWAEKLAAELASRLGIPAAAVELAHCRGRNGSASQSFITDRNRESLFHGNELLAGLITGYERDKRQRQSDHTLENIVGAINKLFPHNEYARSAVLTGLARYMILDALIGNTDRHHENWGLVLFQEGSPAEITQLALAPSFDHASSLGRELSDARRIELATNDQVGRYVRRGRGGIYLRNTDPHGANPLYLVEVAARLYPLYFRPTLVNLARVPVTELLGVIDGVPAHRMSGAAREFACRMLTYSYDALTKAAV